MTDYTRTKDIIDTLMSVQVQLDYFDFEHIWGPKLAHDLWQKFNEYGRNLLKFYALLDLTNRAAFVEYTVKARVTFWSIREAQKSFAKIRDIAEHDRQTAAAHLTALIESLEHKIENDDSIHPRRIRQQVEILKTHLSYWPAFDCLTPFGESGMLFAFDVNVDGQESIVYIRGPKFIDVCNFVYERYYGKKTTVTQRSLLI